MFFDHSSVLGCEADAEGVAFWMDPIDNQNSSVELVAGGFAVSTELQGIYLQQNQWDLLFDIIFTF